MKILMTSLLDLEHDRNGVVTVARELHGLLEASGYPVRIVTPTSAALHDRSPLLRILRRYWRATKSSTAFLLGLLLTIKKMEGCLVTLDCDMDAVIAHDVLTADAALSAVARSCPILLVCHFWTKPWDEFSDAGLLPKHGIAINWLRRKMERVLNNSRIILLPVSRRNEKLLHDILPDAPQGRIQLAYPGVSQPAAASIPKQQNDGILSILNVGRIERRKNQHMLPYVAAALKQRQIPFRFLLVGAEDTEERIRIEELAARLQVNAHFTFYGQIERDAVFKLMTIADLYLHTSLVESFGMTLVEAMACNLPVMAMAYEALSEILPDTPEAIIPRNATPEQIATMIAPLLNDSQRRNDLQTRQRVVYERRFSANAFVSRYMEIIASTIRMNS